MVATDTKPPNDPVMSRRAVAAVHPDRGVGDEALFIWLNSVREMMLAGCVALGVRRAAPASYQPPPPSGATDRINVAPGVPFESITRRARIKASEVETPYSTLLRLTLGAVDRATPNGRPLLGATYKQLSYAAHLLRIDDAERSRWYEVAKEVGLTSDHASEIISKLKGS